MKWSNENAIGMGMGDNCYTIFVPFTMDAFERHAYMYYFNGLNPYLRIEMNFKSISDDIVQGNDLLQIVFGRNYVRHHKDFNR